MAAWSPAEAVPLLCGTRRLPLLHWAQRMFASQTNGELKVTQILTHAAARLRPETEGRAPRGGGRVDEL